MIVIVDYGMGNLGSLLNMLKKIGQEALISGDKEAIAQADKLILPGVGAFDNAMQSMESLGLIPVLNEKVVAGRTPTLGVCLGMQLMTQRSEEGVLPGLGWIDAETVRFRFDDAHRGLKIPHMGWNTVETVKDDSPLFADRLEDTRYYFVHSYHVVCRDRSDALTLTHHGYEFVSSFARGHLAGVQFHPEKSHKFGMKLLRNFAEQC